MKARIPKCLVPSDQRALVEIQADYPETKKVATGVIKRCPRCARVGWVFHMPLECGGSFGIVWSGPGHVRAACHIPGVREGWPDYDVDVTLTELLDPDFGCGNCGPDFE